MGNEVSWFVSEYLTVAKTSEIVLVELKSRFIGRACPVDSVSAAEQFIQEISRNTGMPRTMCTPHCHGINAEQQKCYDDGEPSGRFRVAYLGGN